MSVKETLNNALKEAMKSGDTLKRNTLRMALSAIKYVEVEKGELDDATVLGIIQKEIKSREDTILDAQKSGRPDLIESSQAEIEVLKTFLPQQLSQAELEELIRAAIQESGATSQREMGNVMKVLMPKIKGRADGKIVNTLVQKLLG